MHAILGENSHVIEDVRPGEGGELVETILAPGDLDNVPDNQTEGEENGTKQNCPCEPFTASHFTSPKVDGVTQELWNQKLVLNTS